MKLEKFKENKKLRNTLLTLGITLVILGGGIILYKTYALYQDEHKYNVIKGLVPDFGYDVKFAVVVDDEPETNIPGRKNEDGNYYQVSADCGESTKAEWDYNAWNLKVDNIKSNSKCSLTFTSNLSEEDYKKYIEAGVEYRRNTYRGKNITELWKSEKLYEQIKACTFDDIYVGDYIVSETKDAYNRPITWLIADLNNYRYSGDTGEIANGRCHATIIPAKPLMDSKMNETNTTGVVNESLTLKTTDNKTEISSIGGYLGSNMKQIVLPSVLTNYVEPDFKGHILQYSTLQVDKVDTTRVNQWGELNNGKGTGASSEWHWYYSQIDLMSEVNVFGSTVWSSSGYDIGVDNRQYAIFKLKPEFINSYGGARFHSWLKAVANSATFGCVSYFGYASYSIASNVEGSVRPRFLIG